MSWLFSQALVEDCSRRTCLDGGLSARLNWTGIADAYSSSDRMMDAYDPHSRYGMTFVPLTADRGAALLTSLLAASLAKPIARRLREKTMQTISGRKCDGSWQMQLQGTYLPKTSASERLMTPQTTSKRWVTKPRQFPLERRTWALTTFGGDFGYLHTPTTKANYAAPSMQKWPACRNFVRAFGKPSPENQEWLMGWPIGWSDLTPLETGKFHQWRSQHFSHCAEAKEAA